jgi:hypothetical protein
MQCFFIIIFYRSENVRLLSAPHQKAGFLHPSRSATPYRYRTDENGTDGPTVKTCMLDSVSSHT